MTKLADSLREAIEEEITTGTLAPGARLEEVQLAARFGVSRTPVREALNLLAGEGLLESRRGRGMFVAEVPFERVVEMFEVMGELEAICARHAARRMLPEDQRALQDAHRACEAAFEASDENAYFYANEKFHQLIYLASKNHFLCEQAMALHRKLRPYRRLQLRVRNRLLKSIEEHRLILQALLDGAADEVVALIRSHVIVQGERFADLLASIRGQPAAT
jgi:DNA-binding GntR family transcriptional regulator